MVSSDLLRVADAVRDDGELPEDARMMLDILLSKIAQDARAMECRLSLPSRFTTAPAGCIDFTAERARRGMRPRAQVLA